MTKRSVLLTGATGYIAGLLLPALRERYEVRLTDESVAALARAGLRVAEVGLQTANLAALKAAQRKIDLQKRAQAGAE